MSKKVQAMDMARLKTMIITNFFHGGGTWGLVFQ